MTETILKLERPLAIFDLETTGTDVERDRIVSIAVVKIHPEGHLDEGIEYLVHPQMPIPKESSEIHGIWDADVADQPSFKEQAAQLWALFQDCDLGGFNSVRFDFPVIKREFQNAGYPNFGQGAKHIDAMTIFHKNERRDLSAAVNYYLNREHVGAHGALPDALATAQVLVEQVKKYDIPNDCKTLAEYCQEGQPQRIDATGKLIWKDGEAVFNFGKVKGISLKDAVDREAHYLNWILRADFSAELKEIIEKAFAGEFPEG